ncbi:hypothetical protein [Streptomyces sp. NPDC020965]|uniref:hypothetical protein n=1 Tax=Streptomyces sp. NPDC020965 TaxID=3365105 RepID=UPI00379D17CF
MRANPRGLTFSLVASVAALSLAGATAPAVAAAEPATIYIGTAVTDRLQRGSFSVVAWSDAPGATVTAVSAKVRQGDIVVAEIPALTAVGKPDRYGVPADAVLKLAEDGGTVPALGRYAIDVTVTDSAGGSVTERGAGTLDFTLRPELTLEVGKPSWQDRNARPQGRLTGVQPGSGDVVALPGRTVDVSRTDGTGVATHAVTTTANGDFTAPAFPLTAPSGGFRAVFAESGTEVNGTAIRDGAVSDHEKRPVNVTASVDRPWVLPGERAKVSGRAMYGTEPAANIAVRVQLTKAGAESPYVHTATTGADGRFSVQVAARTQINLRGWVARPADPFLGGSATGELAHPAEIAIAVEKPSLAADGAIKVIGKAKAVYEKGEYLDYSPQEARIERSTDGKTGWKSVGSGNVNQYQYFQLTGKAPAGGHFRVRMMPGKSWVETVSPVFRLNRAETRIASVNAGPEPVKKGGTLTVTGIAGEKSGSTWKALAKKPVQLWFRANGATTWSRIAYDTTDSAGRVSIKVMAVKDGTWNVRYYGNTVQMDAVGTGDYVDVR